MASADVATAKAKAAIAINLIIFLSHGDELRSRGDIARPRRFRSH
jgi:hypothetical protein